MKNWWVQNHRCTKRNNVAELSHYPHKKHIYTKSHKLEYLIFSTEFKEYLSRLVSIFECFIEHQLCIKSQTVSLQIATTTQHQKQ